MRNNFLRSAATHGLVIGLALIILSLVDWSLGFNGTNKPFGYLSYVVMFAGLLWSVMAYRKKEMGGYITYGQALSYSVVVSAFYGLLSVIFTMLLITVIDPTYIDRALEVAEQALLESGFPESQLEAGMAMTRKMMSPVILFFSGLFGTVVVSTIMALITSAIAKKNNPNSNSFIVQD